MKKIENAALYPELINPGVAMKEVAENYFLYEKATAQNGKQYHTLKAQQYPFTVLQVEEVANIDDFRYALNACRTHGWVEYVEGYTDHVVIDLGAWQQLELTQDNAQSIADAIHDDIRNGARWWVLYGQKYK